MNAPMSDSTDELKATPLRLLVIDDEPVVRTSCVRILEAEGHLVHTCDEPQKGLDAALSGEYDVILLDVVMPEMDGLEVLSRIRSAGITAEVVIITGYATVQNAVEAMKHGATDYLSKPFTPDELRMLLSKVMERSRLLQENAALRRQLEEQRGFEGIIGESRAMERVYSAIKRMAPSKGTVLICGESGTGKELVARAVHQLSDRKKEPFLACDCSTLTPNLLESELFGHVKGSFTGASITKQGLFEVADKGTLFLDEIGNINLEIQGKLLRVLETRRVRKVGDTAEREVDIRLIAATNRDLRELVRAEKFREDLYYRLNVLPLDLPPLRERNGDIVRLAMAFLNRQRKNNPDIAAKGFSQDALSILENYAWPGNVRELKNIVQRLAILCDEELIKPCHLPSEIKGLIPRPGMGGLRSPWDQLSLPASWDEFKEMKKELRETVTHDLERRFLVEALRRSNGNVSKAAEDVGMQRTNFHSLMHKHDIPSGGDEK